MIEVIVENVYSTLNNLPTSIEKEIDRELTIQEKNYFFIQQKVPYWDGKHHLYSKKTKKLLTGCLRRALNILQDHKLDYVIKDLRKPPELGRPLYLKAHLRSYQEEAIDIAIKKQRGVIQLATGGGKSLILAGICAKLNLPTLVLTHKKELMHQLEKTFRKSMRGTLIGRVGDGEVKLKQITIGMIQTLTNDKYQKELEKFQVVLVDECHHTPCNSISKILKRLPNAFYRIGVTATNFRDDGMDLMIEAYLGPIMYIKTPNDLISQGYLVRTHVLFDHFHHTNKDKGSYTDIYYKNIVLNEKRNDLIVSWVKRSLFKDLTCLVAVTRVEHGQILCEKIKKFYPEVRFVQGEDESDYRMETLNLLNKRKIKCVVCTTIFGEGVDVPSLDVLINAKAQDSSVDSIQLAGRVMRPAEKKSRAYVVDILDDGHPYFEKHAKNRIKAFRKMGFEIKFV